MSENDYDFNLRIERLESLVLLLEQRLENVSGLSIESMNTCIKILDIMKKQNEGSLSIAESVKILTDKAIK